MTTKRVRLDVWTSSDPTPAPLPTTPDLRVAPVERFERIGRRKWRLFYVSPSDAARDDAAMLEPGWYFEAASPSPLWLSDDPVGPYDTLKELREDAADAMRSG